MSCRSVTDQILHKVFHKIFSKSRSSHRSICHQRFCKISGTDLPQIFHKIISEKLSKHICTNLCKTCLHISKKHRHPKKSKKAPILALGGGPPPNLGVCDPPPGVKKGRFWPFWPVSPQKGGARTSFFDPFLVIFWNLLRPSASVFELAKFT